MEHEVTSPDRRTVVQACALVTLGLVSVPTLAACGGDDASEGGNGSANGASSAAGGSAGPLAKLSDVPVGGGLVATGADGKPIVILQPSAGQVSAVSAVCTHMGTTVAVSGTQLKCPAHGSVFGFDGSVVNGPATAPLAAVAVKVDGANVVAG